MKVERLSIGLESPSDIVRDLEAALESVRKKRGTRAPTGRALGGNRT